MIRPELKITEKCQKTKLGKVSSAHLFTHSSDELPGGSLGWKVRGSLTAEFEKVAYELVGAIQIGLKVPRASTYIGAQLDE